MTHNSALSTLQIAVVDDHALIREGLKSILSGHGIGKIDAFANANDLVRVMDEAKRFGIYIIDLELPDIDGFVLMEMIRARHADARIIVSTVHEEVWTLRKLLSREVDGIIYKSGRCDEVIQAILCILGGNRYYCQRVKNVMASMEDPSFFPSERELEILRQIARGKTSREIAAALFVTVNTVEAHRKSLFMKLGATNVADLIAKAIFKGYVKKGDILH
ncbi:MAG: response regulator transcription factor [Muribaculum sp.]|nr:response regulator transcription factor [Muribaculum sp.]